MRMGENMEEPKVETPNVLDMSMDEAAKKKEFVRLKPEDVREGEDSGVIKDLKLFTSQKYVDTKGKPKEDIFALVDTEKRQGVWVKVNKISLARLKKQKKVQKLGELVNKSVVFDVLTASIGGKMCDYILVGGIHLKDERKKGKKGEDGLAPES